MVALDFFNGLLINKTVQSRSLTARSIHKGLKAVDETEIEYKALYPMASYHYESFEEVSIQRKVVSPIVRGDKKLCSLPVHWNEFEVTNLTDKPKTVVLVQALSNLVGSTYQKQRPGVQDSACTLTQNPINQSHHLFAHCTSRDERFYGVRMGSESTYQSDIEGEVLFGASVNGELIDDKRVTVSAKPSLYSVRASQAILDGLNTGRVNAHFDHGIYSGREALSALVTVKVLLQPKETVSIRFVQAMDHSKISLQNWQSQKAYTQFYPQLNPVVEIVKDILPDIDAIEARIVAQQSRYLEEVKAAMGETQAAIRFATMAMNTLSFLADSTVWDQADKFLVKECVDYPFFNSLDVYFYGSFSLLYLLPELDGCVMREFAKAILAEDKSQRRFWEYEDKPNAELIDQKYQGVRAIRGAVIHDLGSPFDIQPDAYTWHNVKEWKDLAPKYILMVLRHYKQTGDLDVVKACWPAVTEAINYLVAFIDEGDALPFTRGTDDTFDNLASHGISIYCASLWVAGLYAGEELASLLGERELAAEYSDMGNGALAMLERGLWDEAKGYFHFYITPIQAKHLTGKGYGALKALGLVLTGDKRVDKESLNEYLDTLPVDPTQSKLSQRRSAKQRLLDVAPDAFTAEYRTIFEMDSDNSFGDALLADSYLKWMGLQGIFSDDKVSRTLDYIYKTNFKTNSPKLGVANMTLADGMPHEAFQAQDVWIGVQFSVATALRMSGKNAQATELLDTVYDALYNQSKIPFAAPEGFNCSVQVTAGELANQLGITSDLASQLYKQLVAGECLLNDGRVNPAITQLENVVGQILSEVVNESDINTFYTWLKNTGLKYTAGRYFRPGMIFSYIPEALK